MLGAQQRSSKYQFYILWFDLTVVRTHDLHSTQGEHANHYITIVVTSEHIVKYRADVDHHHLNKMKFVLAIQ
jgi:hypothetical protein